MPSFGPSARDDDNRKANTARLINCYRQAVPGDGRTRYALKAVPSTSSFADTGGVFFRAMAEFGNDIYAAYGGTLYRINNTGASASIGSIQDGQTSLSSNSGYLTVAANGSYYAVQGNTISAPTGANFSSVGSVGYLDLYTLLTQKGGRQWAWSGLADPTSLPALNFATAEATDDDLLRVVGLNGRVVLFKETGREVWYNTQQSGANAFKRLPGGVRNIGLKGYNLLCRTTQDLFFIGNDDIARLTTDGLAEQMLSYPPVDTALANGDPTECFFYEAEGQKFCVIRFSDRPSWIFDLATGEWHERAEGATHEPWSARGSVEAWGTWYVATDSGLVQGLTQGNADVAGVLKRTAISPTYHLGGRRASVSRIELYARTGYADLGRDAQMWIRLSRDGGATWTNEKWQSLGDIGDHEQRAVWLRQGLARQLTIEANISEPAEIPLWSDFDIEAA